MVDPGFRADVSGAVKPDDSEGAGVGRGSEASVIIDIKDESVGGTVDACGGGTTGDQFELTLSAEAKAWKTDSAADWLPDGIDSNAWTKILLCAWSLRRFATASATVFVGS